ncbi:MAG: tetratricopeptide repeat protein [Bdellovibrionales bacterium]|jgi:tetratricopeptide (TPR) repeat protein|nr:tetratricopeptide repeat protein [Bdellovibrionales bacterium]MBT3527326.1 tetratricopeptide repeat protein [Bdellovibrionales bacterium]MBT7766482.1 tetratricopeptide repeat protein [Bdellovibrionales bacterium]
MGVTEDSGLTLEKATAAFVDGELQSIQGLQTCKEQVRSNYLLAKVLYDKADLEQAYIYFTRALEQSSPTTDLFTILKILGFLIRICSEKLEPELAEQYIKQKEQLIDSASLTLGSLGAEYFFHLGNIRSYRGEFEEADRYFQLCNQQIQKENDPELLSKCLLALATNSFHLEKYDLATDYLKQLEQLLAIIRKGYVTASMYYLKGRVNLKQDNYKEAIESFEMALEQLRSKKSWNLQGHILLNLGIISKQRGRLLRARDYLRLAQLVADPMQFKRLDRLIQIEMDDIDDHNVGLYLDRTNRKIYEKSLGIIDFHHRFVLFEILYLLAKNAGESFDKDRLARSIWKDEYNPLIHDKLIYTSVSRLRKLVEPKGQGKYKYILRGKDGYTFNPNVKICFHRDPRRSLEKSIGNVEPSTPV